MQPHTLRGAFEYLGRAFGKAALNQERISCTSLNVIETEYLKTKCREKDSLYCANKAIIKENGNKKIIKCDKMNKITISSA